MLPTVGQYNTTLQTYRNLDIRIDVLNFNLDIIDEISGLTTQIDISSDADSDIRKTANVSMILKSDYTRTSSGGASFQSHDIYWTAGNSYWFDKYIKIYVAIQNISTQEFEWVNQGVYMLNSPSVSYDATTNNLSFQAVDMMAKITGMRNGYLEGTYNIPTGSNIEKAIEGILLQTGFTKYILYTPPQEITPYEINIDVGSTIYNVLSELRDINANWEMYFDEDGVFIFQAIPSGNVENPNTGEMSMLAPLVTPTVWNRIQSSYDLSTDFEQVKNYVAVLGKTHEADKVATNVNVSDGILYGTVDFNIDTDGVHVVQLGLNLKDIDVSPVKLTSFISTISITGLDSITYTIDLSEPIMYENTYYVVRIGKETIDGTTITYKEFLGDIQPFGVSWENNPDSPFYVGQYKNNASDVSDYRDEVYYNPVRVDTKLSDADYMGFGGMSILGMVDEANSRLIIDVSNIITEGIFSSASINTGWNITVRTPLINKSMTALRIIYGNNRVNNDIPTTPNFTNDSRTSIGFSNTTYLINITKKTDSSISVDIYFPPIEASMVSNNYSTDSFNPPQFTNQVRFVCVGDEYDNIYSNDLAVQQAKYEIYLRARLHDSISITTVPIYWLGVNEIIQYNVLNEVDINGNQIPSYWLVKSLNTSLSTSGTQTVNAIRYYPLYPSI